VYDYVAGKADWLAHGLPRDGETASVLNAGDLVDPDPPTCALADDVAVVRARLEGSRYGYCLVLSERRILLGRVRRSALSAASEDATAERVMEPGPSTVRAHRRPSELISQLAEKELKTAIVTTPEGCLIGVFHRADAERLLNQDRP
jgi:Mg/Co/Ni transporter MgtE